MWQNSLRLVIQKIFVRSSYHDIMDHRIINIYFFQQVEDYAQRKGVEVSTIERWLEVNLAYSDIDADDD